MQRDIKPFNLNEWTNFKLDTHFPFLLSDIVIKRGSTVIPASNYELGEDTEATAQESGLSGKTLYGKIRITNVTYTGVELNVSGSNFGTYCSNDGVVSYTDEAVADRVEAVGTSITAGEIAIFAGTEGDIQSDNKGAIAQWDAGTIYNVAGTLVRREGITYVATGQATNQGIDPSDPNNALYWYEPEDVRTLKRWSNRAKVVSGDFHTIHNRASANYRQNLKIGRTQINGANKEFHLIHLDGSTVTGNSTLTNLLSGNPYLDIIAPETGGIRTLIDMSSRHIAPQSSGGDNDTLGALLEDRFQGHWHNNEAGTGGNYNPSGYSQTGFQAKDSPLLTVYAISDPRADNVNGTPRTGSTTRSKELTVGASYIVVIVGA